MFFVIPTSFLKMAEKRKKQTNKQTPKQLKLRKWNVLINRNLIDTQIFIP